MGRKKTIHNFIVAWLFLMPSFIGVLIFVCIPFLDVIRRSFSQAMTRDYVGFSNYKIVFANEAFLSAVKNTIRFLIVCIPLLILLSLFFSVLLSSIHWCREFLKTVFLIPMAIPAASIVLLWKIFFHNNGLLNHLLQQFDKTGADWVNSTWAFWILIFTYVWKNIGYDMILWLAGLNDIPDSLYEAASVDGAGSFKKFWFITMPSLRPTLFIVVVLSLINSFKVFREVYLIAGDYPQKDIYMLQHLFNNWFAALDIQKMTAAAVLVAISILFLIFFLQKVIIRKEKNL